MKKIFLCAGIGLCALMAVFSQDSREQDADARQTMTVEQAVEYALKNSWTLKGDAIDLEIKKRASDTAWNSLLPGVTASGTLNRANEYTDTAGAMMGQFAPLFAFIGQTPPPPHEETEDDHWSIAAGLSLSWSFNVAMIQSIRAAYVDYEAGLLTWEQQQKQVERDVRKMFYSLLLAQESLKIQERTLLNAKNRADQAGINYRNGRIPQLQMLQAQVAYENQKPQVMRATQQLEQNLSTFAFLLGLPSETLLALDGSIQAEFVALNADDLIDENLNSRLDLRLLNKNIQTLKLQLSALDLSAFTPSLSLSFGLQPAATLPMLKDGADDPWSDRGNLSITLAWNLTNMLPFSSSRQQAKDLKANIDKLNINAAMLTEQARMEIRQKIDSLELSRTSVEASEKSVELAQTAYDMAEVSYRNGTSELLDLRDSEAQLNQARLGMLNEQFNYVTGLIDLEYALNKELR